MKTLEGYEARALEFDVPCATKGQLWYYGLGIAGEAGEVSEKVKKMYRDGATRDERRRHAVILELGDVLWYIAVIAEMIGSSLEEVAVMNVEKLTLRAANGTIFGSGDSR